MEKVYDVAVIGAGPAGLSAAVNLKIRNKDILVFGLDAGSVKVKKAPVVHNYLGFNNIKGEDLKQRFAEHATQMGVNIIKQKADIIYNMGEEFSILSGQQVFTSRAVILATGIDFGKSIKGEDKLLGSGVSYCATCDAPLYKGKTAVVISYIKEGLDEAAFLSEICAKVFYIPLYSANYDTDKKLEIINEQPVELIQENDKRYVVFKDKKLETDGIFIIKETTPLDQLVPGLKMDGAHIYVDRSLMTNIKGLFAAGDCTGKPYQIAKAVGEGQVAALNAVSYIGEISKRNGGDS